MTLCALDLSYYTLAKTTATNKAIIVVMPAFVAKVMDIKNKHLRHHIINLIDNLELLRSMYPKKHNLTLITPNVRFPH